MSAPPLNATHDPGLRSWVESANASGTDFPIQNLPFAAFRTAGAGEARCGVGIGDAVLDIAGCLDSFSGLERVAAEACRRPTLNDLMALGPASLAALRSRLSALLAAGDGQHRAAVARALRPLNEVELVLPVKVAGYTDFFASLNHATNAGRLFRPDVPLLPNYKHVPIAYNGRANSIRSSGAPVQRPRGQLKSPAKPLPDFAPSQRLDHEVELGAWIGAASRPGAPVPVGNAWRHLFGFSLLNDWSARDIQAWEYQPLGPFLAKSFATTVSPWVVTSEALAPFHLAHARPAGDPPALGYLRDPLDEQGGALNITLQAWLSTQAMRERGDPPVLLSTSNVASLYWTFAQMVAHHTSNGSSLDTGDLVGSGTVSGDSEGAFGSLLEITTNGTRPLQLPNGEERAFLADGDEVILTGRCEALGRVGIGFGRCTGRIVAADPE